MIRRAVLGLALLGSLAALAPTGAGAAPTPKAAWGLTIAPMPTNFAHGAITEYLLVATNVGGGATEGQVTLEAVLPPGLKPLEIKPHEGGPEFSAPLVCVNPPVGQSASCSTEEALHPGRELSAAVKVEVQAPEGGELTAHARVEGGGASAAAEAEASTPISSVPVPFGFLPGFNAQAGEADGSLATLAGSHPYQLTVNLGFPIERVGEELANTGHPRDIRAELPRGLIGNPAATPVLCTEAELTSEADPGCPPESQVGTTEITSLLGGVGTPGTETTGLYNMVPPPGAVAELGLDADNIGIFVHLIAHINASDEYRAYTTTNDLLALGSHPIFNVQTQIWGDPSSKTHDQIRTNKCRLQGGSCPVSQQETPFLTLPVDCLGPLHYEAFADSWEKPAPEFEEQETAYQSAALSDCGSIEYEPTIKARPTTNLTDSPSGLDFNLHQPQQPPEPEPLEGRATGELRDATVTFPAGLAVNASQAAGLDACSEEQIGFEEEGQLFSEEAQRCPDAAKIGTLEATSPALVEYNEKHEPERDPVTDQAIPRPLKGSLYLARPFANPFGSLIAVYFVIEDQKSGAVAKLAGEGELNHNTGRLTVRVRESPELPIEDIHVHLFGGNRGALITPPTCTTQTTNAQLTPWSAPEAPTMATSDSFQPSVAPGGGPCPTSEAQMPNAPAFEAGTASSAAGTFSPLVFKLRREDGSQRIARVEATLPPGLTARLAGVAQCPEPGIAQAIGWEEKPDKGALEIADPSCPASSQVGTVTVAVGAGPTPYYTSGRAYLAGPYKGAPLSFVIIAPAIAGPFDLGTVVNRVAVYLDPETARPRAVSDPIPQLIDGIPLDVRKVLMTLDRPNFVLNPTSCDEESFSGAATSALGQIAPLSERFQAAGCSSLPYKPGYHARLFGATHRGGNPSLRAIFTAKPGEANTAALSFALPPTEFIDQAHFRTICTRVQFAANACPAGAVYGHAKVTTPLLDFPLEGPVYLRSSSHELPDLVLALKGPPSQPIEIDLDGEVDSIHGGVRATFAAVPDAPVTKAIVTMQGKGKGLFQNSTNICKHQKPATLKLTAQNGKTYDTRPRLRAGCPKAHKGKKHKKHKGGGPRER